MDGTALVLTNGLYTESNGKTAHGLVRGTERYRVLGIVDGPVTAGNDAGGLLDGQHRGIPVFATLDDALRLLGEKPDFAIVGVATTGGFLPQELHAPIQHALEAGISVVNGLHDLLEFDPGFVYSAARSGAKIIDIRKPKNFRELHFWTGAIYGVKIPRIAVLGSDCAVGKRTTSRLLVEACRARGVDAEMIYTGQTGWLQGGRYGCIFDAIPNDFVSGELEHAIVQCAEERRPQLMIIEGQASLLNPSGPCGAEFIVSAEARGIILQLAPGRLCYKGALNPPQYIPDPADIVRLVEDYGARVLALTLSEKEMQGAALAAYQHALESRLGIPAIRPFGEIERLVNVVREHMGEPAECASPA